MQSFRFVQGLKRMEYNPSRARLPEIVRDQLYVEEHKAAIESFDAAIQIDPYYAEAYNSRGMARWRLKHYDAALSDFDAAIRFKPDYAKAYENRGMTNQDLGRDRTAHLDFDTAIRLDPKNSGYAILQKMKRELEHNHAASSDPDTAIRLNPNYADTTIIAENPAPTTATQPSRTQPAPRPDAVIWSKPDYADYNRALEKGEIRNQSYGEYLLQRMIVEHNLQP